MQVKVPFGAPGPHVREENAAKTKEKTRRAVVERAGSSKREGFQHRLCRRLCRRRRLRHWPENARGGVRVRVCTLAAPHCGRPPRGVGPAGQSRSKSATTCRRPAAVWRFGPVSGL